MESNNLRDFLEFDIKEKIKNKQSISINNSYRDFIHVDDVCKIFSLFYFQRFEGNF